MRSISSGGQPCSVESVTLWETCGEMYVIEAGNPGMAKGGSGDVLAGMLVSLCGQGIDAVPAACTAAWLHGRAGDLAANALSEYGMTPSDMLTQLPILLKRYNSKTW